MNDQLICPTDGVKVNERQVRLVAGLVLITGLIYLLTNWLILPLLLVVDFSLRALGKPRFSPYGQFAGWLVTTYKMGFTETDQAPKRFAALESLAGFCAGCYVYTFYVRLFPSIGKTPSKSVVQPGKRHPLVSVS